MRFILILSILLGLSACGRRAEPIAPVQYWQLASIGGVPFAAPATLGLGIDSYTGRGPCNSFSGALSRTPFPTLTFSPPETTRASCASLALEQLYLGHLQQVNSTIVRPNELVLVTSTGVQLRFVQVAGAP
ncbi:META domain-containing protein [Pelagovum pacificum]|nr:META domain-containing protein [Pelagovum pacificum]QQA42311.1 META domain-containing protein [Pelagovum pacificum]